MFLSISRYTFLIHEDPGAGYGYPSCNDIFCFSCVDAMSPTIDDISFFCIVPVLFRAKIVTDFYKCIPDPLSQILASNSLLALSFNSFFSLSLDSLFLILFCFMYLCNLPQNLFGKGEI